MNFPPPSIAEVPLADGCRYPYPLAYSRPTSPILMRLLLRRNLNKARHDKRADPQFPTGPLDVKVC